MRPQRIWVAPTPGRRGKALADRFRRQLLNAVDGGERFDPGAMLPGISVVPRRVRNRRF